MNGGPATWGIDPSPASSPVMHVSHSGDVVSETEDTSPKAGHERKARLQQESDCPPCGLLCVLYCAFSPLLSFSFTPTQASGPLFRHVSKPRGSNFPQREGEWGCRTHYSSNYWSFYTIYSCRATNLIAPFRTSSAGKVKKVKKRSLQLPHVEPPFYLTLNSCYRWWHGQWGFVASM